MSPRAASMIDNSPRRRRGPVGGCPRQRRYSVASPGTARVEGRYLYHHPDVVEAAPELGSGGPGAGIGDHIDGCIGVAVRAEDQQCALGRRVDELLVGGARVECSADEVFGFRNCPADRRTWRLRGSPRGRRLRPTAPALAWASASASRPLFSAILAAASWTSDPVPPSPDPLARSIAPLRGHPGQPNRDPPRGCGAELRCWPG